MKRTLTFIASVVAFSLLCAGCSDKKSDQKPQDNKPPATRELSPAIVHTDAIDQPHQTAARKLIDNGVKFLLAARDGDEGSWNLGGGALKPAATALALKVLLQHPDFDTSAPEVKKGLDFLLRFRQDDGGIYNPKIGYSNYTACLALMALTSARDPQYDGAVRELVGYLRGGQIVAGAVTPDGKTMSAEHPWTGGSSYGPKRHNFRPDGSNTGMWAQAMHDAGVAGDDPAMKRMAAFFTRLQNSPESNKAAWALEGPADGGFVYAIEESKADAGPGGRGLRSYGSLTYMGFKSMLYAGLSRKDPRVQSAFMWIRGHWTLDANPNMPGAKSQQGLYYYYHVYAKALRAWGQPIIKDTKNVEHNWRHELIDALAKRVADDGSWSNNEDRWNEGSPVLATCFSVLALQESLKK